MPLSASRIRGCPSAFVSPTNISFFTLTQHPQLGLQGSRGDAVMPSTAMK